MTSKARLVSSFQTTDSYQNEFEQLYIKDDNLYPSGRFNFRGASLGDASVDEIRSGADAPNTQSAIMQLAMAAVLPVNTVITSTDAGNPFTTNQFNESITYSGVSTTNNISIYGVSVELVVGDTANEVAEKVFIALHSSGLFDSVSEDHVSPSSTFILKHRSSRPHTTEYPSSFTTILDDLGESIGLQGRSTVTGESDGETSLGYGVWELYYTDSITFPDPMYYYRRIS